MIPIVDEILVGSSAFALITYLLAKVKCVWNNPCQPDQLCIYASNESNILIDDNEIVITAKKTKPLCYFFSKI